MRSAALLLALLAGPAAAQLSGRLVDPSGAPVAGASVEAWTAHRRLAAVVTGGDGRFAFAAEAIRGATSVAAHRMGYQTASTAFEPGEDLLIRLTPAPLVMEAVRVVAAERRACPNRESARARQLWLLARTRYRPPGPLPRVVLRTERFEATVPREEIGTVDGLEPLPGSFTSTALREVTAPDGLLDGGVYGRRLTVSGREHWEYAPLAWGMNPHFLLDRFGALHSFSVVAERPDAVVLAFCPTRRGVPEIEGTLVLAADGRLRSARWRYLAPRSRSEAGGEVDYLPPDPATGGLLLARRGLFWRSWYGRYHFREDRYTEWSVTSPPAAH